MSIHSKPELKINLGFTTPSISHKKINSVNLLSSNSRRYNPDNQKKCSNKGLLNLKSTSNINSHNNVINYNSNIMTKSGINKVMISQNLKNKRIEINLNKQNSPRIKYNKIIGDNALLFNKKQCTSHNNIKNIYNTNNNINFNINSSRQINHMKNQKSLNNINININISKISTFYKKTKDKDKKDIIIKKNYINSMNNSRNNDKKEENNDNLKNNNINDNDILIKNQSQGNFKKPINIKSYLINHYRNNWNNPKNVNNKNNLNNIVPNHSLEYFSTNSNMSTNTNKNTNNTNINNNTNIYINNNTTSPNYINTEKSCNYYTARDLIQKNNKEGLNKIIKEIPNFDDKIIDINKEGKINVLQHSSNINSIHKYICNLNKGQRNKNQNKKNSPISNKTKVNKLNIHNNTNNINYIHNYTESNLYNKTYNFDKFNNYSKKSFSKLKEKSNQISKNIKSKKYLYGNNEINGTAIGTPEELHYFFIKLIQNGNRLNFDNK